MHYVSKPTECEARRWNGLAWSEWHEDQAAAIIAWVNANGGEARYYPDGVVGEHPNGGPRIGVRTINGWAYASPGHYVVMGTAEFTTVRLGPKGNIVCRDFYPCDPETFESRWEVKTDAPEPTVEIGGQVMTQAQFDAARQPLLHPATEPTVLTDAE